VLVVAQRVRCSKMQRGEDQEEETRRIKETLPWKEVEPGEKGTNSSWGGTHQKNDKSTKGLNSRMWAARK